MSTTLSAVEYMDFVGERHKVDFCDMTFSVHYDVLCLLTEIEGFLHIDIQNRNPLNVDRY